MIWIIVDLKFKKQDNSQPLSARSSVGSEYLATNQVVGGSNPSGRAIFSLASMEFLVGQTFIEIWTINLILSLNLVVLGIKIRQLDEMSEYVGV